MSAFRNAYRSASEKPAAGTGTRHEGTPRKGPAMGENEGFSAEERAAMKERAKELKGKRRGAKVDPEADQLAKITETAPCGRPPSA